MMPRRVRAVLMGILLFLSACSSEAGGAEPTPMADESTPPAGDPSADDPQPASPDGMSDPSESPQPSGGQTTTEPSEGGVEPDPADPTPPDVVKGSPDWVSYSNGPRGGFYNPVERAIGVDSVANLEVAWSLTDGEVTAPPVVVGDRVYVTSSNGTFAHEVESGERVWSTTLRTTGSPAYDAETDTLFVYSRAVLHALDPDTGETRWSTPGTEQARARSYASPVVTADFVLLGISASEFATGFKGGVAAIDKRSGALVWEYRAVEPGPEGGAGVWTAPAVDEEEGLVIAVTGNNYGPPAGPKSDAVIAIDLASGEERWHSQKTEGDTWSFTNRGPPDHDFGSTPVLFENAAGRKLLAVGQKSGVFWVMDRLTGEDVWNLPLSETSSPANGGILNNGAFDGTRLIVAANEGGRGETGTPTTLRAGNLYALGLDGEMLWSRPLDDVVWAPITIANGVGFVAVGDMLEAFDVSTGEALTEFQGQGTVAGAAAISDGWVFFGSGLSFYDTVGGDGSTFYALSLLTE